MRWCILVEYSTVLRLEILRLIIKFWQVSEYRNSACAFLRTQILAHTKKNSSSKSNNNNDDDNNNNNNNNNNNTNNDHNNDDDDDEQ